MASRSENKRDEPADKLARSKEEFIRLTKEYKNSLEQLIALYEKDVQRAEERLAQTRELYREGLVSRKNLEEGERAVADAKAKIEGARRQGVAADEQVAEMLVEEEAIEDIAKVRPAPAGKVVRASTYIRSMGTGAWSLSNAWQVQQFFQQRFGRPLPVSAFGQSS
ncbi:MAG TPA: TolC family protein, partial [Pyrinomonadaceae bacterium]|nr:TolC family protein [Pyrinomonadaceae bacterium]